MNIITDDECMTLNWNKGNNCWLKNGDGNAQASSSDFNNDPNMFSNIYYHQDGIMEQIQMEIFIMIINNITSKDEFLFLNVYLLMVI